MSRRRKTVEPDDRRTRLESVRWLRKEGYRKLADATLSRLAREVALDPTTPADIRAEIDVLLGGESWP